MKTETLLFAIIGLIAVSFAGAWEKYDKCDMDYQKVGCYSDNKNNRALPIELLNERDKSNKNFDGHKIDWKNFTSYIQGLACRCAAKTREKGHEIFGLQFYGECWSGDGDYKKHGMVDDKKRCLPDFNKPCNDKDGAVCVGKVSTNYVYSLKKAGVDGGYGKWSDWTPCSKTCGGGGVTIRTRSCDSPKPQGNGKDCSTLGPREETKKCGDDICPFSGVDGGYGEWSDWTPCSKTCGGGGVTRRTRSCDSPKPQGNGKDCSTLGPREETKKCGDDICPFYCKGKLDVGILLDGSSSVKEENFKKADEAIKHLAEYLQVSQDGSHMGIITFSSRVWVNYRFCDDQHIENVTHAIKDIGYPYGKTYTSLALKKAGEEFFVAKKSTCNRPDVRDLLIVFTDGVNTGGIKQLERAMEYEGIKELKTSIAVGIGKGISKAQLNIIAKNNKDNVILVEDFDELKRKLGPIIKQSCQGKDINGGYGEWSDWTPCSKTCGGGGVTRRTRSCDKPKPQDCSTLGPREETKKCGDDMCPSFCTKKLDVGVLLDGSSSVKKVNFEKAKLVIEHLAEYLKVSRDGTHMGIVTFSTKAWVNLRFTHIQKLHNVLEMIRKIQYPRGWTHTSSALKTASKAFFEGKHTGKRHGVPEVMIVFTDGKSTKGIRKLRKTMKKKAFKNVRFLAVGIGKYVSEDELKVIAKGKEENVILADDFDVLKMKLGAIINHTCQDIQA